MSVNISAGDAEYREKVVFMCTGNICRSALAEVVARSISDGFCYSSCGTHAEVGMGMDAGMQAAVREEFDGSKHIARQAYGRDLQTADLIVFFAPEHEVWLAQENSELLRKAVPFGVLERLAKVGKPQTIAALIEANRGRVTASSDCVADPYARGERVYAQVAKRIVDGLRAALPLATPSR